MPVMRPAAVTLAVVLTACSTTLPTGSPPRTTVLQASPTSLPSPSVPAGAYVGRLLRADECLFLVGESDDENYRLF